MRLLAPALMVLLLAPPLALAAAPAPMVVSGTATVNGRPVPQGTLVLAYAGDAGPFGDARTGAGGAFEITIQGDDPETAAREGAREGDAVAFRMAGRASLSEALAFTAGARRETGLVFLLPDLAVLSARAAQAGVAEGEDARVEATVANRGNVTATGARVLVSQGSATLATRAIADVPPGASVPVELAVPTKDLSGNVTLLVSVAASNGDADVADSAIPIALRVLPANASGPGVSRLVHEPAQPVEGVPVTLRAETGESARRVRFLWQVVNGTGGSHEAREAPWQAVVGPFPANATIRWWVVASDAENRTTTTPAQTFDVRAAERGPAGGTPAATTPGASPTSQLSPSATPAGPEAGGGRVPGPALLLVAGAAALAAHARRRRT